jgi:hypothetical protein
VLDWFLIGFPIGDGSRRLGGGGEGVWYKRMQCETERRPWVRFSVCLRLVLLALQGLHSAAQLETVYTYKHLGLKP